jgi:hypothetical protein
VIRSFFVGITTASRSWKMILFLLAANILFSLPVVVPIFLLIATTSGGTLAANSLRADKLDILWLIDVFNHQFPGAALETVAAQVGALLIVMGVSYLLLNTLFAGGVIGIFNSEDGRFNMRAFWAAAGAWFWRFFRLMLISLIFYGVAYGLYALARWPIDKAAEAASAFESVVYKRWAAMILLVLLFAFVNMIFDYAKIGAVVKNSRGMWRETFRAIRFAFRNFVKAFGLYLMIALLGLLVFLALNSLRWSVNQSSVAAVLLAIILGQVTIAGRMWTRLMFYAAELNLYKRLAPAPATVSEEVVSEPQIEFAKAEAPLPLRVEQPEN